MNNKNIEDCIWKGCKNEYMVNYMRTKQIYNKFTKRHQPTTCEECPTGFDRHHIFYVIEDINLGIVHITKSDHMKIEHNIRVGNIPPVPIISMATYKKINKIDPKEILIEYKKLYTKDLNNYV